jgi:hypothetical protein
MLYRSEGMLEHTIGMTKLTEDYPVAQALRLG